MLRFCHLFISIYSFINFPFILFTLISHKIVCVAGISSGRAVSSSTEYPFAVKLTFPVLCSGSIISLNPSWILTAAHCLQGMEGSLPSQPSVGYGSAYGETLKYATIKQAIPHPMYSSNEQVNSSFSDDLDSAPYDIALVQLKETLFVDEDTNRIPLYDELKEIDVTNTSSFEAVGFGYTGYQKPEADALQYAICNKTTDYFQENGFNNSFVFVTSNSVLCHGDSGGPLIYRTKQGAMDYHVTGVLSRIINAYDPNPKNASCPLHDSDLTHFINAFVKPSNHIDWIMNVTKLSRSALTAPTEWSTNTSITTVKSNSTVLQIRFLYILIFITILLSTGY